SLRSDLAPDALKQALYAQPLTAAAPLVHHSDREVWRSSTDQACGKPGGGLGVGKSRGGSSPGSRSSMLLAAQRKGIYLIDSRERLGLESSHPKALGHA